MTLAESIQAYNAFHPATCVELLESATALTVVSISGELDLKGATDLEPVLLRSVDECCSGGLLVLDLSCVSYISSAGVGMLSGVRARSARLSVDLKLINVPRPVLKVFEVLGLVAFFEIEASHA
ncbi:MAG: STAS domain-containing protein [Spirochaetaceae bacterium]|nr:STAS domain-containing protein [Spirochaetaceae bacterium]